jgi:hypothetical protein
MNAVTKVLQYGLVASVFVAGANASLAADRYANVHSVAIVSALGDGILLEQKADVTLNDTAPTVVFDSKLDLDGFATKLVTDAVSARFTVVDSAIDPSQIMDATAPADIVRKMMDHRNSDSAPPVDAFIVIHPDTWNVQTPIRALVNSYSGLSLMHIHGLFGGYDTILSIQYTVTVFDAKTGKVIDFGTANLATRNFLRNPKPLLFCDGKLWPDDPEHLDDARATQLRTDIMAVMARSLPIALEGANLIEKADDLKLATPAKDARVCKSNWF